MAGLPVVEALSIAPPAALVPMPAAAGPAQTSPRAHAAALPASTDHTLCASPSREGVPDNGAVDAINNCAVDGRGAGIVTSADAAASAAALAAAQVAALAAQVSDGVAAVEDDGLRAGAGNPGGGLLSWAQSAGRLVSAAVPAKWRSARTSMDPGAAAAAAAALTRAPPLLVS